MKKLLSRIDHMHHAVGPDWYAAQIAAGDLYVVGVFAGGELGMVVLLREETITTAARELVIVAAAGRIPGVDLTRHVLPAIEDLARSLGCQSVRLHTMRKGLIRKTVRHGYMLSEIVMRKALA